MASNCDWFAAALGRYAETGYLDEVADQGVPVLPAQHQRPQGHALGGAPGRHRQRAPVRRFRRHRHRRGVVPDDHIVDPVAALAPSAAAGPVPVRPGRRRWRRHRPRTRRPAGTTAALPRSSWIVVRLGLAHSSSRLRTLQPSPPPLLFSSYSSYPLPPLLTNPLPALLHVTDGP